MYGVTDLKLDFSPPKKTTEVSPNKIECYEEIGEKVEEEVGKKVCKELD
jgi:hypothetical protein